MKLKDLLKGRDKLRKYDELNEWKERFKIDGVFTLNEYINIPADIREIIIDAIDAEIKKMEEE